MMKTSLTRAVVMAEGSDERRVRWIKISEMTIGCRMIISKEEENGGCI